MTMKWTTVVFLVCKFLIFLSLRFVFRVLQTLYWRLSGVSSTLHRNRSTKDPAGQTKTAHVLTILCRYKCSELVQPNSLLNFIATHEDFVYPDVVLRKNVSLYTVSVHEAVFVETDPGIDVTVSTRFPFLRIPQFELAMRLIILPISSFHRVVREHQRRCQINLIFLPNTLRCGSTLLCQIFEKSRHCVALSEPDAINDLARIRGKISEESYLELTESVVKALCLTDTVRWHAIKFTSLAMSVMPTFHQLFPEASFLFVYRDGLQVAQSISRVVREEPLAYLIDTTFNLIPLSVFRFLMFGWSQIAGHNHTKDFPLALSTSFARYVMYWGQACAKYKKLREEGIPVVAVKYEDLVSKPSELVQLLFEHCGLPDDSVEDALVALQKDSQRNCSISREKLRKHVPVELTPEMKEVTDFLCDYFELPRIPRTCILEGTVVPQ